MYIPSTFKLLDQKLRKLGEQEVYIYGGAALILLKVSLRATMGVDILEGGGVTAEEATHRLEQGADRAVQELAKGLKGLFKI